jgi:hypothetical protein
MLKNRHIEFNYNYIKIDYKYRFGIKTFEELEEYRTVLLAKLNTNESQMSERILKDLLED